MSVTGDFDKLQNLMHQIGTGNELLYAVTDVSVPVFMELIDETFENETDPYGRAWAPRVSRSSGSEKQPRSSSGRFASFRPILQETRQMRRGYQAERFGNRLTFRNVQAYWDFHQRGTSKMVARKTVPEENDLPHDWAMRIFKRVDEYLHQHLKPDRG